MHFLWLCFVFSRAFERRKHDKWMTSDPIIGGDWKLVSVFDTSQKIIPSVRTKKFTSNHIYPNTIIPSIKIVWFVFTKGSSMLSNLTVPPTSLSELLRLASFWSDAHETEHSTWTLKGWNRDHTNRRNSVMSAGYFPMVLFQLLGGVLSLGVRGGGVTIEAFFLSLSLVVNADISECLWGWANSTCGHGLASAARLPPVILVKRWC